jgi:hypothetical protein
LLFFGIFCEWDSHVKRVTELSLLKKEYKRATCKWGEAISSSRFTASDLGKVKTLKFYTSPRSTRYNKKTAMALCVDGATDIWSCPEGPVAKPISVSHLPTKNVSSELKRILLQAAWNTMWCREKWKKISSTWYFGSFSLLLSGNGAAVP